MSASAVLKPLALTTYAGNWHTWELPTDGLAVSRGKLVDRIHGVALDSRTFQLSAAPCGSTALRISSSLPGGKRLLELLASGFRSHPALPVKIELDDEPVGNDLLPGLRVWLDAEGRYAVRIDEAVCRVRAVQLRDAMEREGLQILEQAGPQSFMFMPMWPCASDAVRFIVGLANAAATGQTAAANPVDASADTQDTAGASVAVLTALSEPVCYLLDLEGLGCLARTAVQVISRGVSDVVAEHRDYDGLYDVHLTSLLPADWLAERLQNFLTVWRSTFVRLKCDFAERPQLSDLDSTLLASAVRSLAYHGRIGEVLQTKAAGFRVIILRDAPA